MGHAPEQLAATLTRRARQRRMEDEKRLAHARAGAVDALRACIADGVLQRAWLIGSAAWGAAHSRSDLDVVVEGISEGYGLLWDRLSEAAGMDVDLLRPEELDEGFRTRVLSEGVEIDEL
jgi:predicted nucleotidyltransferase